MVANLAPMRRWVFEMLGDHAAASGRLVEAISMVQKALVDNDWDESPHERMLNYLLHMNQISQAQDHYRKVVRKLAKSGQMLSEQFRQKYETLINPPTNPAKNPGINWNIYGGTELPFVGQQIELDRLVQQYLAGGTIIFFGESGMGKTRLLAVFIDRVLNVRIILAQACAREVNLPYQPIIDALRVTLQPTEWLRLPAVWANQLVQLFPELNSIRSDLRALMQVDPDQARAQIHEALRQLVFLLNPNQRLVLILDDGQWSDEWTLAALEYLIIRLLSTRKPCWR